MRKRNQGRNILRTAEGRMGGQNGLLTWTKSFLCVRLALREGQITLYNMGETSKRREERKCLR